MQALEQRFGRRLLWVAAAGFVALATAIGGKALYDPNIPFLPAHDDAAWIVYPSPGEMTAHDRAELDTVFRRSFSLDAAAVRASLRVRAFRRFTIRLNGESVATPEPNRSWKAESRFDVSRWLRAGANEIEISVGNEEGPPALWLALEWPTGSLATNVQWQASLAGAAWRPAALATEPMRGRRFDPDRLTRPPLEALATRWSSLLGLAALAAFSVLAAGICKRCWPTVCPPTRAASIVAVLATLLMTALFINDSRYLHPTTGYDAQYHLAYIRYILDHGSLPTANHGWQTYQPPLYYLVAAALLKLTGTTTTDTGGILTLRLFGLGCGIANLFLVTACMRRLFPENARRQVLGAVIAASLPSLLCLYQFPGNEMLLVTLTSATLLAALRLLHDDQPPLPRYLVLGACVGLALLAKVSALLLALALLFVLVLHTARRPRQLVAKLGIAVLTALLLSSWHYLHLWSDFGSPLVGNWDKALGMNWWQDPGYRTLHDYTRFGRALVAPMFAGFGGVVDGLYSSLWGDGLCSGFPNVGAAPPWPRDFMAMAILLALLPSAALLVGGVASLVVWLRRPTLPGTLLGALAILVLAGILFATLRVPSYAQAKASYGLSGLVPLCACIAVGLDWTVLRRRRIRPLVDTAIGTWALLSFAALWIHGESPQALITRGTLAAAAGQQETAAGLLGKAAADDNHPWSARLALAQLLIANRASPETVAPWLAIDGGRPDLGNRHYLLASILRRHLRNDEALDEALQGIAQDPDSVELRAITAAILTSKGDLEAAVAAWQEALRIMPHSRVGHESLAHLFDRLGRKEEASLHRKYLARLPGEQETKR
jgi:hypothetical protein